ncbi:MAG: uracil-DNA glycosylase family protein [Leptolyngbya sp. SIO3F4]|nr:uracil-DNA glycosylase family protein [Leptolyngbya sp. SIO3F4]
MQDLLARIRACTICSEHLPEGPRPVFAASTASRIVVIGQAPGRKVHMSGIPWDDPSGNLLRTWLEVDRTAFYDPDRVALIPMGFCYPGKGSSGDLPPRPECAPQWHDALLEKMSSVRLTLLIGQYAQRHYLRDRVGKNLTETVRHFEQYLPEYLPLPHPSPRNRFWLKKNPWFEEEVLPVLRMRVRSALQA